MGPRKSKGGTTRRQSRQSKPSRPVSKTPGPSELTPSLEPILDSSSLPPEMLNDFGEEVIKVEFEMTVRGNAIDRHNQKYLFGVLIPQITQDFNCWAHHESRKRGDQFKNQYVFPDTAMSFDRVRETFQEFGSWEVEIYELQEGEYAKNQNALNTFTVVINI